MKISMKVKFNEGLQEYGISKIWSWPNTVTMGYQTGIF